MSEITIKNLNEHVLINASDERRLASILRVGNDDDLLNALVKHTLSHPTEDELEVAKEKAWNEGYEEGQEDGKDEGLEEGYKEGLDDGYKEGFKAGYEQGYNDHKAGLEYRYSEAQNA